jgi:hypothetical protein
MGSARATKGKEETVAASATAVAAAFETGERGRRAWRDASYVLRGQKDDGRGRRRSQQSPLTAAKAAKD